MSPAESNNVVQAWLEAAARDPSKRAIAHGTTQWTRRELRQRAFAWSAQLETFGPTRQNIAIQLPHGAEAIAAIIGTLAAGHCFVALDPSQPAAQRIATLDHVEARIALCAEDDAIALKEAGWAGTVICPGAVGLAEAERPAAMEPADRACLCLTSGSSAAPKAVVWSHRTLACAAQHLQMMFSFTEADRHALVTPPSVAAAHAQIFAVLAAGGTLCLFEARRHSISDLAAWLQNEEITTLQTIPPLFRALGREAAGTKMWPSLRAVKLGGETSTVADARLFETFAEPSAVLINGLGLTEAGFNVCWFHWRAGDALAGNILPIGRPPPNLEVVVERADDAAAGPDEAGEIVVRSPALADGYWRNSALTERVYGDVPGRPSWRELRTGDAGCWRSDGLLEHRGRLDQMLKIRGQRVDPAEVESLLAATKAVAAVAVVPIRDHGSARLCAFVQLDSGSPLTAVSLCAEAAERMPDYMVPGEIRVVDALPRLANGKLDRQGLAALAQTPQSSTQSEQQVGALEQTLHGLFSIALRRSSFRASDSFFDLGGDSLAAVTLFTAIESVLGIELPLSELVRHPTVEALAARIRETGWNLTDHPVSLLTSAPAPDAVNLFAWPGAGSDVMALCPLAQHLGAGVALYGIQHRGADCRRVYDFSVAEVAERGVKFVREVQPRGPYALCGASFGGLVALEVARRLRAAGETVAFLGLLDTYAPGYPTARKGLGVSGRVQLWLRLVRPIGYKDEPGIAVIRRGLRERWRRALAALAVRRPDPGAPILPMSERFIHLQEACFYASRHYRPKPYNGATHIFSVEEPPDPHLFELDQTLGWAPLLTGPLHLATIPGRHGMHIREPHVRTLAAKLRAALEHAYNNNAGPAASMARDAQFIVAPDYSSVPLHPIRD